MKALMLFPPDRLESSGWSTTSSTGYAGNPTEPVAPAVTGLQLLSGTVEDPGAQETGDPQVSLLQATDTTINPGARTFNLNVGTRSEDRRRGPGRHPRSG